MKSLDSNLKNYVGQLLNEEKSMMILIRYQEIYESLLSQYTKVESVGK